MRIESQGEGKHALPRQVLRYYAWKSVQGRPTRERQLIKNKEREQYRLERWAGYEEVRGDSGSGDSNTEDEDKKARVKARKSCAT